jgi:hypothetical protein
LLAKGYGNTNKPEQVYMTKAHATAPFKAQLNSGFNTPTIVPCGAAEDRLAASDEQSEKYPIRAHLADNYGHVWH